MSQDYPKRPTAAFIDLDALAFNFQSAKQFIGPDPAYMAVVKADAYGHGAVRCAQRLEREGVDWFGVATLEEGTALRDAEIRNPILLLGGIWPGQESLAVSLDLTPAVFRLDQAELLDDVARKMDRIAKIHVKIDTGMGRLGIRIEDVSRLAGHLSALTNIEVEGLMTHFAAADSLSESDFTQLQMARFAEAVAVFASYRIDPKYITLANSPGAVAYPESRSNLVRLGGVLYGLGGDILPDGIDKPDLRPIMAVTSEITLVKSIPIGESIGYGRTFTAERDSIIATVPIGYHDGLPRSLSNQGRVIINGEFAPLAGRISMDWTTVDVTDIPGVTVGDRVTIIGSDGGSEIRAEEIAGMLGTISYEITCGFSSRVPRTFLESGADL